MDIRLIDGIKLSPKDDNIQALRREIEKRVGHKISDGSFRIKKRSVDARHKDKVIVLYTVEYSEKNMLPPRFPDWSVKKCDITPRPVVVGSGPAGMLCALTLAKAGVPPIVLERGPQVDERTEKVNRYFETGILDSECNVQFGEGGAGTFSDGKLTTGVKDPRMQTVLSEFIAAGAPEEIAYQSKPHIGTDILRVMVRNIRKKIISLGGEYRFGACFDGVNIKNGKICSIKYKSGGMSYELECDSLVLAPGHSSRDTFSMLYENGIVMTPKAFSIGARIEHPQELISRAQYGDFYHYLAPADYKLSMQTASGRGVYTFCMCPGGYVVAAASEKNSIVTNGMSLFARDGENANSAVLVGITPRDFGSEHPLAGIEFQRKIERAAYSFSGTSKAPAQLVGDLLAGVPSTGCKSVIPSYRPGVTFGSIDCCLPDFAVSAIKEALPVFGRKIRGFDFGDAVLTAPESRSSSPVRIERDETMQSSVRGIYPCGEGAGYAGGIMSAAADGIKVAEALLENKSEG